MRIVLTFVAVAAALLLACCDPTQEYKYYTQGIGTELDSSTIAADTQLQNQYLSDLCEQAGLSEAPCLPAVVSNQWGMVVQAGMNDIDQRCDAFLGWLDEKRRNQEPILNELHTVAAATQAIMNAAGVGANPITIVGVAFGLASDTFTNVRSSLLLEVDKSTVETIVINAQNRYRQGLANQAPIDNRAAAVYALRSYLRICTPFTISNQINTTVTLVERGVGGAVTQVPMVNPAIVATTTRVTAREPIRRIPRSQIIVHDAYALILDPYDPKSDSESYVKTLLSRLCVPPSEITQLNTQGTTGPITQAQIAIFENAYDASQSSRINGKLDLDEQQQILGTGACSGDVGLNYFEKVTYGNPQTGKKATDDLITSLNKAQPEKPLPAGTTLSGARSKIAAVRASITDQRVQKLPISLQNEMTRDLLLALPRS